MSKKVYYQRNRKTVLNKAKKYYNDKNYILKERARNK